MNPRIEINPKFQIKPFHTLCRVSKAEYWGFYADFEQGSIFVDILQAPRVRQVSPDMKLHVGQELTVEVIGQNPKTKEWLGRLDSYPDFVEKSEERS